MEKNIVSFINMKGGVGKTTLCIGLGEYLARFLNYKILFIDVDPQFNATQSLMNYYDLEDEYMDNFQHNGITVKRIFEMPAKVSEKPKLPPKEEIIIELDDNISIIAGTLDLITENSNNASSKSKRLKKFITENNLRDEYDFIFIDCPPTISLFTDAALLASDFYLTPIRVDRYSTLGILLLDRAIENLSYDEGLEIKPLGIVYTMQANKISEKTRKLREVFEKSEIVKKIGMFENETHHVNDLLVGQQGNISSSYKRSKDDIKDICNEFLERVEEYSE
ncbi:ParA family protein [Eubacterium limosum]|uniref:ParA family protein n=1 Tax=Eubacterium limosum TaxID=1736 RepID=A0ABT5UV00_EUBLI|nr:ParA family protein [Eubacterium limosum]MDE1472789.1 ParA family protein [Eubacterium limosum]